MSSLPIASKGFVLVLAWASLACGVRPSPVDTGIRGQVLRGPVTPGPQRDDSPDEAPFSALFHVLDREEVEVTRFQSDEDGHFEIALAPGEYAVVPDASAPIMSPSTQRREVTVPPKEFAEVTWRFDTGIR